MGFYAYCLINIVAILRGSRRFIVELYFGSLVEHCSENFATLNSAEVYERSALPHWLTYYLVKIHRIKPEGSGKGKPASRIPGLHAGLHGKQTCLHELWFRGFELFGFKKGYEGRRVRGQTWVWQ
jgi:hypothetical protein